MPEPRMVEVGSPEFHQAVAEHVGSVLEQISQANALRAKEAEEASQAELDAERQRIRAGHDAAAVEAEKWEGHTHEWGAPGDGGQRVCGQCQLELPASVIEAGEGQA